MILLVVAVVGVSYYAVVVSTWWPILIRSDHGALSALAALIIFVFHFLVISMSYRFRLGFVSGIESLGFLLLNP